MSNPVIGIDLGTTNSCIATIEHGLPVVVPNAEGGRTTPSVAAFLESGERLVGAAARRQAVANPEHTVFSVKRFMGRKITEVDDEQKTVPYSVKSGPEEAVRIGVAGSDFAPEQISAMILTKLKQDAEAYFGRSVDSAVITVPAYFNDAQRQATKDAAEIAGIEVLRLVNEPTAAALAYGVRVDGNEQDRKILVVDLGGGTYDVSVLEIADGVFEVRATHGDNHLGGDDFDKAIVDYIVDDFLTKNGLDLSQDSGSLQRLYEAAEKAKIELSSAQETQIALPFVSSNDEGPVHLEMTLSRADIAVIAADLLSRLAEPIKNAIKESGVPNDEIDDVLLVGGMTRMPAVQEAVHEITGKTPLRGVNPDEAVAMGAAIQAAVLSGDIKDVVLLDVIPLSLGIETNGGIATKLIEANTTIPTKVTEIFTTSENNQPSVEVHVVQGERQMAADNRSLGRVVLVGVPYAPAGIPQIEVTFAIDSDGVLDVTAVDLDRDVSQELRIEASTKLSNDLVEQMREDASKHANHDMERKHMAELRNEVRSLSRRIMNSLDTDENLNDDQKEKIVVAVADLDKLLVAELPDLQAISDARNLLIQLAAGDDQEGREFEVTIDDEPEIVEDAVIEETE